MYKPHDQVVWPKDKKGKLYGRVDKQILSLSRVLLFGKVLCLDVGTQKIGYSVWDAGVMVANGSLEASGISTVRRLKRLQAQLQGVCAKADLVVIEWLRGPMVAPQLHWSVGALLTAVEAEHLLELPIMCWKSMLDKTYVKNDKNDARSFGEAVFFRLVELSSKQTAGY